MRKLISVAMMIIVILLVANCSKNEQVIQEVPKEVTTETIPEAEVEVSSEDYPEYLKDFYKEADREHTISEANNKISLVLFKIIDEENKNLVFSSFSISNALAMAAETTNEEISNSIRRGLRLPKDVLKIRDGYQSILKNYGRENKDYILNIANALWIDNKYSLESERQENIEKYYLGQALAFDNLKSKDTADRVNDWCDAKTNGMIKKIINEGDIHSLTHLILTNAIYFKGSWQEEFDEGNTSKEVFYNSLRNESQVDFMKIEENFAYTEDDNVQVLKMNYRGRDFSMLVILPRENDIRALQDNLTSEILAKWNKELKTYKVNVQLPKFKFDFDADLNEPLKKIGMARAFTSKTADELYIDKVLHKAIIDVNEKGTEAAAVTAVAMTTRSMPPQYEYREFNANHPFIFVIQDNKTQNILFMGKVENPVYEEAKN